jgi:hypothetical protein
MDAKPYLTLNGIFFLAGSADELTRDTYHAYLEALGVKPGERPSREVGDYQVIGGESSVTSIEGWSERKVQVCSMIGGRVRIATVTAHLGPYDEWHPGETVVERSEAERAGLIETS